MSLSGNHSQSSELRTVAQACLPALLFTMPGVANIPNVDSN
jgi:hypothetical protein